MNVTDLIARYGYFAVAAIVGLESAGIPLPGETTLIAAALYAAASHKVSIIGIIASAAAGAIVGDNLGYAIGYWGGYRLLLRYGRYIGMTEKRIKVARYLFMRFGGQVVFFGRFVSILRAYAAFLAGTNRMPWRKFFVYNAAGGIVWATLYGIAAYTAGKEIDRLSRTAALAFAAAGVIAIIAGALVIRRHESALEVEAERALPGPLTV